MPRVIEGYVDPSGRSEGNAMTTDSRAPRTAVEAANELWPNETGISGRYRRSFVLGVQWAKKRAEAAADPVAREAHDFVEAQRTKDAIYCRRCGATRWAGAALGKPADAPCALPTPAPEEGEGE